MIKYFILNTFKRVIGGKAFELKNKMYQKVKNYT